MPIEGEEQEKIIHDTEPSAEFQAQNDEIKKYLEDNNMSSGSMTSTAERVLSENNPLENTGFEDTYVPESHEFEQGFLTDVGAGIFNGFVVSGGEGLANLIPTVAQAFTGASDNPGDYAFLGTAGPQAFAFSKALKALDKKVLKEYEADWAKQWKTGVTNWFDAQRLIYSDKANQEIKGFDDINSAHVAKGIGEGIGFVGGIILGSKGAGALGKSAGLATKGQGIAARIGSFMTGTTLMYPMVEKEAKQAGLNDGDAARFALGVSGVVSLTEGIALEWIGKIAASPVTRSIAKESTKDAVKLLAKEGNATEALGLFTKSFGKKFGTNISKIVESAAVETGQEFSQTYIENGAQQMYDAIFSKDKEVGDDKFGTDTGVQSLWGGEFDKEKRYENFVEATFGGLIGGIIGGGMGGFHGAVGGSNIAEETTFGYINASVRSGKPQNIQLLKDKVADSVAKGDITEEEGVRAEEKIDDLEQFARDGKSTGIKDGVALYQMFQLDKAKKEITKINEVEEESESSNESFKKLAKEKKGKVEQVIERIQENFDSIFESKKPQTNKKATFEEQLDGYTSLVQEIRNENIDQETIDKKLDKLFDPKAKEKAQAKQKEAKMKKAREAGDFGKTYNAPNGGVITDAALTDEAKSDITAIYGKAMEAKNDEQKQAAIKEAKDKYGIDKDGITAIATEDIADLKEVTTEEKKPTEKEGTPPEEEFDSVKAYKKIDEKLKSEFPEYDLTQTKEALVDGEFSIVDKNGKVVPEEVLARKKEIEDEVFGVEETPKKVTPKEEPEIYSENIDEMSNSELAEYKESLKDENINGSEIEAKRQAKVSEVDAEIKRRITKEKTPKEKTPKETTEETPKETKRPYKDLSDSELEDLLSPKEDYSYIGIPAAEKFRANEVIEVEKEIELRKKATSPKEQEQEVDKTLSAEEQAEVREKMAKNAQAEQTKEEAELEALKKANQGRRNRRGKPQEQRKRATDNDAQLIKDNPKLYNEIKKHFKRIFPFIPMKEVNKLGEKYGAKVLGRLVESGIEIDPSVAIQTTLVHEYGHVFLEVLGDKHPLVKLGYKIIEGTDFFREAQQNYPDATKAVQLKEALNEAIAVDSLDILKRRLDGAKYEQFKEWLKTAWSKLKKIVGKANQKDITRILSRSMTLANKPFSANIGSLVGLDMEQRKGPPVPTRVKNSIDLVYESLAVRLLHYISDKDATHDFKSKQHATSGALSALLEEYYYEKENPTSADQIFKGVDLGIDIKTEDEYGLADIKAFGEALKKQDSDIYNALDTIVASMFKSKLELDALEEIDTEVDQGDETYESGNNAEIKATKRVSLSVRSILSTLVDDGGNKIGSDAVFAYVSNMAEITYKKAGLIKALKDEALNDVIARRMSMLIERLQDGSVEDKQKLAGFLQEISSLIQVKSEGTNLSIEEQEDGEVSYRVTNPIRNKDKTFDGLTENLENLTEEEQEWLGSLTNKNSELAKAVREFWFSGIESDALNVFLEGFSDIIGVEVDSQSLKRIIDNFNTSYYTKGDKLGKVKYTKGDNFIFALGSTAFETSNSLLNFSYKNIKLNDITGYLDKIFRGLKRTLLNNTYLNGANNTVTTTQLGHWVSTLNSMLMNDKSGRVKAMQESDIYKNNPVFKYFVEQGKVEFSVFDSLKNFSIGSNVEYSNLSNRDYMMLQLQKFATSSSKEHYSQTLGVKSNRTSATFFQVPSFSTNGIFDTKELVKAYNEQVQMLQPILTKMLKGKTAVEQEDLLSDFEKLYVHSVDKNGKITSALDKANIKKHADSIAELKTIAKANGLDTAFSKKVGKNSQFRTFDQMVEAFFFVEAINRTSLNDIYSGVALEYANLVAGNKKKGGVQQNTKRMSSSDSNGKQIEINKPIHYIVYKTNDSGADSFKFNGSHLTEHINNETGSLDPLGINSKELVFQVEPNSGQSVYIKSSGLNLKVNKDGTNNLNGFGENMSKVGDAMLAVEKMLATEEDPNPYVVFMDDSASKGTYNFKTVNFQEVMDGNMSSVKGNVNTLTIDNLTTPFNLNKALKSVDKQETVMSTQAAIIQFNAGQDFRIFEEAATQYLKDKMKGKKGKRGIVEELSDFNSNVDELTKDMNEREKSATTEILEGIKTWNAKEENKDRQITVFDNPSLRLVYEQFVASRLSKRGTKVEMSGNFMHQLPDFGGKGKKLEGKQVAVSWKMFFNEKPTQAQTDAFLASADNKVVVVRIPSSAEMSIFAGNVAYFLDTDANVVTLSDEFVEYSDSDHDGDKAMVYRKDMTQDGNFKTAEESPKTKMFDILYANTTTEEFEKNRKKTLDLDPIREAVGIMEGSFATSTINAMADVAKKMGLGQVATGRFAVAGKLMALLSQSEEGLVGDAIDFNGKKLKAFVNDSLDDIARLLQAALDIGNDPILSETGFTETTINVGNAMLLLGLNTKEVVSFLNTKAITALNEGYNKENLAMGKNRKKDFDTYYNNITTKVDPITGERKPKSNEEIGMMRVNGDLLKNIENGVEDILKYGEFKVIGDDLSKMISYIKLDKGLPKSSELNRALIESLQDIKSLSFSTENLMARELNKHRVSVANEQRKIYAKQLVTSNSAVLDIVDEISAFTENSIAFKKKAAESIMKMFAQQQIKNPRTNLNEWMYTFADKIKAIKEFKENGEVNIVVDELEYRNANAKNIYDSQQENPLMPKSDVVTSWLKANGFSVDADNISLMTDLLTKYENAVNEVGDVSKFADNKFIQYVNVEQDEKGRTLLKLNPKFKTTTQVTEEIKDAFIELQEIDPELAEDIIAYQLYRHGVNNKIGSFIDVLPIEINLNELADATQFKNELESVSSVDALYLANNRLQDNLLVDNAELLSQVVKNEIEDGTWTGADEDNMESFVLLEKNAPYVNLNGAVYVSADGTYYNKISNVQSDENFTAFDQTEYEVFPRDSAEENAEPRPTVVQEEFVLPNGTIFTTPLTDTFIEVRGGIYTVTTNGDIINNTPGSNNYGNLVTSNSPIRAQIIEAYQIQQAEDLNNNCK